MELPQKENAAEAAFQYLKPPPVPYWSSILNLGSKKAMLQPHQVHPARDAHNSSI